MWYQSHHKLTINVAAHHPDTTVYPEAGHGFMRDGSDDYSEAAATDAWSRLLAHFGEHLV